MESIPEADEQDSQNKFAPFKDAQKEVQRNNILRNKGEKESKNE
jgi:hypothetical protein